MESQFVGSCGNQLLASLGIFFTRLRYLGLDLYNWVAHFQWHNITPISIFHLLFLPYACLFYNFIFFFCFDGVASSFISFEIVFFSPSPCVSYIALLRILFIVFFPLSLLVFFPPPPYRRQARHFHPDQFTACSAGTKKKASRLVAYLNVSFIIIIIVIFLFANNFNRLNSLRYLTCKRQCTHARTPGFTYSRFRAAQCEALGEEIRNHCSHRVSAAFIIHFAGIISPIVMGIFIST